MVVNTTDLLGNHSELFLKSDDFFGHDVFMTRILFYYDDPQLFIAKSDSNEIFLVLLNNYERDWTEWVMVKTDRIGIKSLVSEDITFLDFYINHVKESYRVLETEHSVNVEAGYSLEEIKNFYSKGQKLDSRSIYE